MTKQVWVPQRFVVPPLQQTVPASFNFSSGFVTSGPDGIVPSPILIDLRPYISGGRLPYRAELLLPLPLGLVLLEERLIIKGARPANGTFAVNLNVYDAFGSFVTVLTYVLLAYGPLAVTGAYPDIHNGVPYNYAPSIIGGVPPYRVVNLGGGSGYPGSTANLSGLIFDNATGRLSGTPVYTGSDSLGNLWGITVTDSATPTHASVELDGTNSIYA